MTGFLLKLCTALTCPKLTSRAGYPMISIVAQRGAVERQEMQNPQRVSEHQPSPQKAIPPLSKEVSES